MQQDTSKSQKNVLVVFDFDYTLYNAEIWKTLTYNSLAVLFQQDPVSFRLIAQKAYDETRQIGYFEPKLFAKILVSHIPGPVTEHDVMYLLYNQSIFKKCYYPDTVNVLQLLNRQAKLGLFSTNDSEFQAAKQQLVASYFEPDLIFIDKNKVDIIHKIVQLAEKYHVYLVDDLLHILQTAKQASDTMTTIWVKQGPYALQEEQSVTYTPDFVIDSIAELPKLIEQS